MSTRAQQCLIGVAFALVACVTGRGQIRVGGSPFYEFKVVTSSGQTAAAPGGPALQILQVNGGLAVNNLGQVAVPVRVYQNGSNAPAVVLEIEGQTQPVLAERPRGFIPNSQPFGPFIQTVDYADSGRFAYDFWSIGAGLLQEASIWRGTVGETGLTVAIVERRTGSGQSEFATHASWPSLNEEGTIACFSATFDPYGGTGSPQTNDVTFSSPSSPGYSFRRHVLFSGVSSGGVQQLNYPVIGQHGVFAVVKGQRTNDASVVVVDESGTEQVIASTAAGWQHFGWFADMTQDSKFVAFAGRRQTGEEGIFVSLFDAEWTGHEPILLLDTNFIFAVDVAGGPIRFRSFDFRDRPCIIHQNAPNPHGVMSNSIVVVFHATPSAPSRPNAFADYRPMFFSGQPGLWAARFTIENGLKNTAYRTVHFRSLVPIIQVGDQVPIPNGSAWETVALDDLQVFNGLGSASREASGAKRRTVSGQPMPGDHVVAFWAKAGDRTFAIKGYHLDSDGDGLLDHWERGGAGGGIDMDRDGIVDLPLADLGADELRRDLFLEVDWTGPRSYTTYPGGWKNQPTASALFGLVDMFANAPVTNFNGSTGIVLHIDAGNDTDEYDGPLSQNGMSSAPPGQRQGGDSVTTEWGERPDIVFMNPNVAAAPLVRLGELKLATFNSVKERFFGTTDRKARELAFRYAVISDFTAMSEVTGPAGPTNVFTVASATPSQLTTTTVPFPAGTTASAVNQFFRRTGAALMLNGPLAGQVRRLSSTASKVNAVPVSPGANSFFLQVNLSLADPPFSLTAPADSQFVILNGFSGSSEMFVMRTVTGFSDNDQHRLPGNDLVISPGRFRLGAGGLEFNSVSLWRTFAHELGHTLGLAHGGRDVSCAYDGNNHFSLMSYSHQFRVNGSSAVNVGGPTCPSPITIPQPPSAALAALGVVQAFSDGTDNHGFNEWAYLRPETWAAPWVLGNTLFRRGNAFGDSSDPESEPELLDEGDLSGPVLRLDSPTNRVLSLGDPLVLAMSANDPAGVVKLRVQFDADGDGAISSPNESGPAATTDFQHFSFAFPAVTGSNGVRAVTIDAWDGLGNQTTAREMFLVGSGYLPDLSRPNISFTESPPIIRFADRPLDVSFSVYDDSVRPLGGIQSVRVNFDRNGDGITSETEESYPAVLGTDYLYHPLTGALLEGVTNRTLTVIATDRWGHTATNSQVVTVLPPDRVLPVLTPLQPEPGSTLSYADVLPVLARVTDNHKVAAVSVYADMNGNGQWDYGEGLIAEAGGSDTFKVVFGTVGSINFKGPPGPWTLRLTARDYYGNVAETNLTFIVADTHPPQVAIVDPPNAAPVSPAAALSVKVFASDDRGLDHVWVRYDDNGNGVMEPDEIQEAAPASPSVFLTEFVVRSVAPGPRLLEAVAVDASSRTSRVSQVVVRADAGFFPGGLVAATSRSFLPVFESARGLGLSEATFRFDTDGNGSIAGPAEEFAVLAPGTNQVLRAFFSNLSGPPGIRPLSISLVTSNGQSLTLQTNVNVWSGGEAPSLLSLKLASVPFLPEPGTEAPGYLTRAQVRSAGMSSAARLGSNIVFGAYEIRETYNSLWVTDGSPTGTRLLARVSVGNLINGTTDDPLVEEYFTQYRGRLFFNGAQDPADALAPATAAYDDLWETDGTTEGTRRFGSLGALGMSGGMRPAVFQDRLYYLAYSQTTAPLGKVLIRSDGTAAGTVPVHVPGLHPDRIAATASNLFLLQWNQNPDSDGWWVSDGTTAGTWLLTNLAVQVKTDGASSYRIGRELASIGNLLFFPARTATNGIELWRTDGTPQGTLPLADIEPGAGSSFPNHFAVLNDTLYFAASNSLYGTELWRSDGTPAGTWMVSDILPGFGNSLPSFLTAYNGRIYFQAVDTFHGSELWVSDGTAAGTQLYTNLAPFSPSSFFGYPTRHSSPGPLGVAVGRLFFEADNGLGDLGRELWSTDGTAGGATLVRDIAQVLPQGDFPLPPMLSSFARRFTDGGSYLAFRGYDNLYGSEIWRSDGTAEGTFLLKNDATADAGIVTAAGGTALFQMADPLRGRELGSSRAGFGLLRDVNPGPNSSAPTNFVWLGSRCFFSANQPVGPQGYLGTVLYITDGTAAGTVPLAEFDYGGIRPGVVAGGRLVFAGTRSATGIELWVSDGTPAGTFLLGDLNPGDASSAPSGFIPVGARTFFVASNAVAGLEWWGTDGTPAGTFMLPELMPGSAGADPLPIGVIHGQLLFFGQTPANGWEPMALNPDSFAMTLLADTLPGASGGFYRDFSLHFYTNSNRAFLFSLAPVPAGGLWVTDGTSAGTRKVGGPDMGTLQEFISLDTGAFAGEKLVFSARGFYRGRFYDTEPWVSDGTVSGTMLLTNIMPDTGGYSLASFPSDFISTGTVALFTANETETGRELWRSDGTPAGTFRLADIRPGPRSSLARQFSRVNNRVVFTAYTEATGRELWSTDGTSAGTTLIEDLNPGPQGSDPVSLFVDGDTLYYFAADHGDDLSLRSLRLGAGEIRPILLTDITLSFHAAARQLEFSYQRRLDAIGLGDQYAVEASTDLATWREVPHTELSVTPATATEAARVRLEESLEPRLFVRVRLR